ncbi:MAG TPA: sigma-70 family RNA polymerase sigma factor [Armatimonadota bacterium]|nr:sigma-70 family RNA polymerase sigma factor [Armatimonadota bacterium]
MDPRELERYRARVRTYIRAHGYHFPDEDEDDLTQETLLRAIRALPTFRGQSIPYTWLYRIATNLIRDRLRWRQRHGRDQPLLSLDLLIAGEDGETGDACFSDLLADPHPGRNPEPPLRARVLEEALGRALRELPAEQRQVFLLVWRAGATEPEIAAALGCGRGTVKSRLSRARTKLRAYLGERELL